MQIATTFKIVYGWMCAGLALSGVIAWYTAASCLWKTVLQGPGFFGFIIAELALVFVLSLAINKLPVAIAYLMFLGYAALNGLTLSVVFIAYEIALVQKVFFITAGMFGGLALWGTFTKSVLSSIGSVCGMALWGLIIAGIVNLFTHSSGLDLVVSFAYQEIRIIRKVGERGRMPRLGPMSVSANVYGPRTDTPPSAARKRETDFPDNPNFLISLVIGNS